MAEVCLVAISDGVLACEAGVGGSLVVVLGEAAE